MDKVQKILEIFGKKFVDDVRKSARSKGMTYGGGDSRLSASMDYTVTKDGENKITMVFFMEEYGYIRDVGRGKLGDTPTPPFTRKSGKVSQEGQKKISEWAKRKNIVKKFQQSTLKARVDKQNEAKKRNPNREYKTLKQVSFEKAAIQLGFLISRKVGNKGYKGNHFYTDVVNKIDTGELSKQISEILKTDILIEIRK